MGGYNSRAHRENISLLYTSQAIFIQLISLCCTVLYYLNESSSLEPAVELNWHTRAGRETEGHFTADKEANGSVTDQ